MLNPDELRNLFDRASSNNLSFNELTQTDKTLLATTFREVSLTKEYYKQLNKWYLEVPPEVLEEVTAYDGKHKLNVLTTTDGTIVTPGKVLTNVRPGESYNWLVPLGVFDWKFIDASSVELELELGVDTE